MLNPQFLLSALIIVLVPGTGAVYTISTGLTLRWRASIAATIGCTLGILPHMLASILGLSALMHMSAELFSVLKIAGAIYLLYLAWQMWRDTGRLEFARKASETNAVRIALKGIAINLLNPKLTIFFFAFLPVFIAKDSTTPTQDMLGLSAIFMLMTFVVFLLYGVLASAVSTFIANSVMVIKRFQQLSAILFAGLAVKLALSER